MPACKVAYFLRTLFHIWLITKYAHIIYRTIYYLHGSLQCILISLNVVRSSKSIQVLILTKNHHFPKLVLIYGITTMKST